MHTRTTNTLQEIGEQLDQNQFPLVYNGGIVMPRETAVFPLTLGKEKDHVKRRQRRPTTRSRYGTTRRQRQTNRSWTPNTPAQIINTNLHKQYEAELGDVRNAYPNTKIWHQAEGLWLLTESNLLPDLGKKATFLTVIPYIAALPVRSWGFWTTSISIQWIGPRHTNFPDGSICAFEPRDDTWVKGDSIVDLLDFYTLWALRHLYFEKLGKWPGYQSVPYPYERLSELRDDEFCGCSNSNKFYEDCCKKHDLARNQVADAVNFLFLTKGGLREPPKNILNLIRNRKEPPSIMDIEMYQNLLTKKNHSHLLSSCCRQLL